MEPSELIPDDEEHSKGFPGVLNLGQEVRRKAEGQRDLGRLVEVGLEDVLVKNEEALKNLKVLLVENGATNLVVELCIGERLNSLEALVGESRPVRVK